jgi:hypothetical protein
MLERFFTALALAFLASIATTGVSSAALLETQGDVMIATGLVAIGLMVLLFVAYSIKHAFGLDKIPPPLEAEVDPHGAGHGVEEHVAETTAETEAEPLPEPHPVGHH